MRIKRLKLKPWAELMLLVIAIVPILILSVMALNSIDNNFVENCMNNGYSQNYCERSK